MDLGVTSIYGKVAGRDAWTRLSPPEFVSPIPDSFFSPLVQHYFGLSPVGPVANRTRVGVVITLERIRLTNVRREKGRAIQWEEDIPPGNCCSSRKQSGRGPLVTAEHEASDVKGPAVVGSAST